MGAQITGNLYPNTIRNGFITNPGVLSFDFGGGTYTNPHDSRLESFVADNYLDGTADRYICKPGVSDIACHAVAQQAYNVLSSEMMETMKGLSEMVQANKPAKAVHEVSGSSAWYVEWKTDVVSIKCDYESNLVSPKACNDVFIIEKANRVYFIHEPHQFFPDLVQLARESVEKALTQEKNEKQYYPGEAN